MTAPKIRCELISWSGFYNLSRNLSYKIHDSGFRPDLIIAMPNATQEQEIMPELSWKRTILLLSASNLCSISFPAADLLQTALSCFGIQAFSREK